MNRRATLHEFRGVLRESTAVQRQNQRHRPDAAHGPPRLPQGRQERAHRQVRHTLAARLHTRHPTAALQQGGHRVRRAEEAHYYRARHTILFSERLGHTQSELDGQFGRAQHQHAQRHGALARRHAHAATHGIQSALAGQRFEQQREAAALQLAQLGPQARAHRRRDRHDQALVLGLAQLVVRLARQSDLRHAPVLDQQVQ